MKVPYKIICTPVAIKFTCPHCNSDIESKWSIEKAMAGVTVCPKCNNAVKLGKGEIQ